MREPKFNKEEEQKKAREYVRLNDDFRMAKVHFNIDAPLHGGVGLVIDGNLCIVPVSDMNRNWKEKEKYYVRIQDNTIIDLENGLQFSYDLIEVSTTPIIVKKLK